MTSFIYNLYNRYTFRYLASFYVGSVIKKSRRLASPYGEDRGVVVLMHDRKIFLSAEKKTSSSAHLFQFSFIIRSLLIL